MKKLSTKERMLKFLKKTVGYNTFTVAQGQRYFGIQNVTARIDELRQDGNFIYTNRKTLDTGRKICYYRLGQPTKAFIRAGLKHNSFSWG